VKNFHIEDTHLTYLHVQCGDIAHLIGDDEAWRRAYNERIERVYQSMLPALPAECTGILDVGGGLSGIGARLCDHYYGIPRVAVLDGRCRPAEVVKHNEPFNNATYTSQFLRQNGVKAREFFEPHDEIPGKFDLIISTQAWCFHIVPHVYLPKISRALAPGGTVIVDVRKAHPEWVRELGDAFGPVRHALVHAEKWVRYAYRRDE
jgi:SAM-dependent methyltransferase